MSDELLHLKSTFLHRSEDEHQKGTLQVTAFHGGRDNGSSIQLTLGDDYISLVDHDVQMLATTLQVWLDTRHARSDKPYAAIEPRRAKRFIEADLYVCSHCFTVRANPLIHFCPVCDTERHLSPLAIDFAKRIFVIADTAGT